MQQPLQQPRVFSIEGNIGAGKTTILEQINHPKIFVLREPVEEWMNLRDSDGNNILSNFYKDPKKYGFAFQVLAFHTRKESLKKAMNSGYEIILCERSLHADAQIFAKMLYEDGVIDDMSYRIYDSIYKSTVEEFPFDGVIYLDVEPNICAGRIRNRARPGEENIQIDYLNKCHDYHVKWLKESELAYPVIKFTGINDIYALFN